jgi:hypothetical protein
LEYAFTPSKAPNKVPNDNGIEEVVTGSPTLTVTVVAVVAVVAAPAAPAASAGVGDDEDVDILAFDDAIDIDAEEQGVEKARRVEHKRIRTVRRRQNEEEVVILAHDDDDDDDDDDD